MEIQHLFISKFKQQSYALFAMYYQLYAKNIPVAS